jgi:hypothetical protein
MKRTRALGSALLVAETACEARAPLSKGGQRPDPGAKGYFLAFFFAAFFGAAFFAAFLATGVPPS